MKVEMDANGTLLLTPESGAEVFALKKFEQHALILVEDTQRGESTYWRGSALQINNKVQP